MTAKHTSNPWSFKHEFAKHYSITHNGYWIGRMRGKENAQLVSAAPDLLEALKALTHSLDVEDLVHDDQRSSFAAAIAAIAKATGKDI